MVSVSHGSEVAGRSQGCKHTVHSSCCAQILLCAGENALRDKGSTNQLEDEAIMTHCSSHELLCAYSSDRVVDVNSIYSAV